MACYRFFALGLVFGLLAACAPGTPTIENTAAPTSTRLAISTKTPAPTHTEMPGVTPTPTFPRGLFDTLPALKPISGNNPENLIRVASVDSAQISNVFLTDLQDQIVFHNAVGVQPILSENFAPGAFVPLSASAFESAISPNGLLAAELVAGKQKAFDGELVVTDLSSGKAICSFSPIYVTQTRNLTFHFNHALSFSRGENGNYELTIWNLDNCHEVFDQKTEQPVYAVSQDGLSVAIGDGDKVYIHSISSGQKTLLTETSNLRGVYFLPYEKYILVTSQAGNAIFNLQNGEKLYNFPRNMGNYYSSYHTSEDGKWLIISGVDQNCALNMQTNRLYNILGDYVGRGSAIVENGYIVTKDYIWSLDRYSIITYIQKYGESLADMQFTISADGTRAAISSTHDPYFVDILDLTNGKVLFTIAGFHNPRPLPHKLGFIATGKGKTGFFTYSSEQPTRVIDLHYIGQVNLGNGFFATWDNFGTVSLLDPSSQSVIRTVQLSFISTQFPLQNLAPAWGQASTFSFDAFLSAFIDAPMYVAQNRIVISHNQKIGIRESTKGSIQIFNVKENSLNWNDFAPEDVIATISGDANEFVFSPDDRLVAGVFQKKITVWQAATGKLVRNFNLPLTVARVYGFAFSPDGSKLLISNSDMKPADNTFTVSIHSSIALRVFNLQTGGLHQKYVLKQKYTKSGCNISLPFSVTQDGTQVLTVTQDCKIGFFDINTWKLKQEFGDGFSNANISFALSPDNRLLAVAYKDKLELWNISAAKLVKQYTNPSYDIYRRYRDADFGYIYQAAFSPDGRFIGTRFGQAYTLDSIITLWGIP